MRTTTTATALYYRVVTTLFYIHNGLCRFVPAVHRTYIHRTYIRGIYNLQQELQLYFYVQHWHWHWLFANKNLSPGTFSNSSDSLHARTSFYLSVLNGSACSRAAVQVSRYDTGMLRACRTAALYVVRGTWETRHYEAMRL